MTPEGERHEVHERPPGYLGKAILAFFLYGFGWIFGFILNVMFYNDAKRDAKRYGETPPGFGCLSVMLWFNLIGLAVLVVVLVLGSVWGARSSP